MLITEEAISSLSDDELERFIEAGKREQKTRAERERQETIAKIKELARAVGVPVSIGGVRGRPAGNRRPATPGNNIQPPPKAKF